MRFTLSLFKSLRQRYPATLEEYLRSGFGPVNADSINRMTGDPFSGDGRANDLIYGYRNHSDGGRYTLRHTEEGGRLPEVRFGY